MSSKDSEGLALLEVLVQAKLPGTLDRVADQGRDPSPHKAWEAALLERHAKALANGRKLLGVDLHVALHHVQGRHRCVSESAAKRACKTATFSASPPYQTDRRLSTEFSNISTRLESLD